MIRQFIDPVATAANIFNGVPVPLDYSRALSTFSYACSTLTSVTSQNFAGTFSDRWESDGQIYCHDTVYNTDLSQLGTFQIQGKATLGGNPILTAVGYFQSPHERRTNV